MLRRASLTLLMALLIAAAALPVLAEDSFFPGWRSRIWPQAVPPPQPGELTGWRIVIDPGHGGTESGACPSGLVCEKVFNLAISLKLQGILEEYGAEALMTRTTDTTVTLQDRVNFANSVGAHRFLSVHINSAGATARGIETWVDADGVDETKNPGKAGVWRAYAQTIHDNLISGARTIDPSMPDRGLKYSGITPPWNGSRIFVIRSDQNKSPAALVEIGFISNSTDYALLLRDDYQYAVAHGMANGFLEHARDYRPQDGVLP